jgi:hypothetical protein
MTDRELMDKAWDYLAAYTVGERPNASDVNDLIAVIEDRMNQPERQWVGLTEEEVKECFTITPDLFLPWHIYARIEAKLKEKNGG